MNYKGIEITKNAEGYQFTNPYSRAIMGTFASVAYAKTYIDKIIANVDVIVSSFPSVPPVGMVGEVRIPSVDFGGSLFISCEKTYFIIFVNVVRIAEIVYL